MLKEFTVFLKTGKTTDRKNYFNDYFILFLIVFAIGISISLLKSYYYDLNIIDAEDLEYLNWETVISYVLVVPLIEEIIFRAPMLVHKAKIYSLLISLVLLISSFIYLENDIMITSVVLLILILQILYLKSNQISLKINNFIKKNYLTIIYLTSISFGLIHMTNYDIVDFKAFISVIGRVVAGFYFAFIVTKYDFKSSYFLHGINNAIPFLLILATK